MAVSVNARLHREAPEDWRPPDLMPLTWPAVAFALFAFVTTILLRVIHHYLGVEYQVEALLRSTVVQATLSISWGLMALGGMVAGTRHGSRYVWFVGAVLLGVVLRIYHEVKCSSRSAVRASSIARSGVSVTTALNRRPTVSSRVRKYAASSVGVVSPSPAHGTRDAHRSGDPEGGESEEWAVEGVIEPEAEIEGEELGGEA